MNKRFILWGVPAVIWLAFTAWYTDFGGPLTDEEVANAITALEARGDTAARSEQRAQLLDFLKNDTGGQFLMVNNIDMNDNPPPMPDFGPDATASDYMDHYMEHMYRELLSRACHPIFYGVGLGFDADIYGIKGAEGWETAALFRYRSRRTFLEIITHPEIGPRHEYKLAAMTKTIAYPVEPVMYFSDPRFLLFLIFGFVTALIDILLYGRSRQT